ncbi:Zinc finger CCHC domain-containing protein 12 [Bienertia sinuspersici]
MGENIILRFQYLGKDTDVVSNDIDNINLIDLIVDYWEISKKENTPFPANPLDMIHIWVGESKKPTKIVQAATKLMEMVKINSEPNHAPEPIEPQVLEPRVEPTRRTPPKPPKQPVRPQVEPTMRTLRSRKVILDNEQTNATQQTVTTSEIQWVRGGAEEDLGDLAGEGDLVWDDDCEDMDNYLQRLYRNSEFYQDKDFRKIEIKEWQLFIDKLHLREVLRDYCIQSGFVVVVETANTRNTHFKAAVDGFLAGCKGVVGVDGTFLKGNYGRFCYLLWHLMGTMRCSPLLGAIDKACSEFWPGLGRRYCTKHLSVNFKKMFPGPKMWQLFWLATEAYSDFTFEKAMKQIEKHKHGARMWLANLGEQESDSRTYLAYLSAPGGYEIVDGKSTLPVSLNHHTCKYNQWQLTGIPCKHGMRAILYSNLDPLKFVHEWYSVKRYKMAYGNGIRPIPDREQWAATEVPSIQPPLMKRRVGRPVKNRRRGEEEQRKGKRSSTLKCSKCGEFGHNCLTCARGQTKKAKSKGKEKSKGKTKDKQLSLGAKPVTNFKPQITTRVITRSAINNSTTA